jgi:hypothetical protein
MDPSLPKGLPADMKYMIAANLRNNQDLMPHWMRQLLIVSINGSKSTKVHEAALFTASEGPLLSQTYFKGFCPGDLRGGRALCVGHGAGYHICACLQPWAATSISISST